MKSTSQEPATTVHVSFPTRVAATPLPTSERPVSHLGLIGWLIIALAVASLSLSIAALFTGGIGWDSRFDTDATNIARSMEVSSLQEAYDVIPVTTEFYGLLVYQLADLGHRVWTGSPDLFSPDDPNAYVWQGLVTITCSLLAALALAWSLTVISRRRVIGATTAALLLATPLWLGSSSINYKDVPVAAGLSIFSAALAVALVTHPTRMTWVSMIFWSSIGASMAFATRAGSVVLLVALSIASLGIASIAWRQTIARVRIPAITAGTGIVLSVLVLLASNPVARLGPWQWMLDSWAYSTGGFPWVTGMLTMGTTVLSNEITWWYIPIWLLAQLPILTALAALSGLAIVLIHLIRTRFSLSTSPWIWLTPFLVQGLVFPLAVVVRGTEIYDGIRHVLFIVPPFIVFAVIPLIHPLKIDHLKDTFLPKALPWAGVFLVAVSFFASLRWFPYSYAYVNPIAGFTKEPRQWELDYWGVSSREGIRTLENLQIPARAAIPYNDPARPFSPGIGMMPESNPSGEKFGYYWFARWTFPTDLPFECERLFDIRRDGHVLGHGGVCQ